MERGIRMSDKDPCSFDWNDCWASDINQVFDKATMQKNAEYAKKIMARREAEILQETKNSVAKVSDMTVTINVDTSSLQDSWPMSTPVYGPSNPNYIQTPTYVISGHTDWTIMPSAPRGSFSNNTIVVDWERNPNIKPKLSTDSKYRLDRRTMTDIRTVDGRIYIEVTAEYTVKDDMGEIKMPQLTSVMWWRSGKVTQKQIGRFYAMRAKNSSNILSFLADEDNSAELISSDLKPKRAYGAEFQLFRRFYRSESFDSSVQKMLVAGDKGFSDFALNPNNYTTYNLHTFKTDKTYSPALCADLEKFLFSKDHKIYYGGYKNELKLEDMHIKNNDEIGMRVEQVKDKVGIYDFVEETPARRKATVWNGR